MSDNQLKNNSKNVYDDDNIPEIDLPKKNKQLENTNQETTSKEKLD
jgi:hypothetical protein